MQNTNESDCITIFVMRKDWCYHYKINRTKWYYGKDHISTAIEYYKENVCIYRNGY